MVYKKLIGDERLTPTMERARSGSTQLFREKKKDDRSFISEDNCDISLKHDHREMYAELIDGKWYWVSGCTECLGKPRGMSYIECHTHNRCRSCETNREDITESVWGGLNGWICKPCYEAERLEIRRQAFEKFNEVKLDEDDFHYMDEIKCPHCGSEISSDDLHESQDIECEVCEGEITLEVEYTAYYSTSIKGERVTE